MFTGGYDLDFDPWPKKGNLNLKKTSHPSGVQMEEASSP